MRILTVVESKHLGNTLKIAQAMAEVAPITITNVENAPNYNFHDYDIVGFGSGIYYGRHDKDIMELVNNFCDKKAYSFVFSTSGDSGFLKNNSTLVRLLEKKNKIVLGSFGCRAHNKYSFLKLIGGINKGHPDKNDYKQAQKFILDVIKNYEISEGKR